MDFSTLFSKKNAPVVGLDISSSCVKAVELSDLGKGVLRLDRYASEPIPRGAIADGNIDNIEQVGEAVQRVWKKLGTRAKAVVLGMPPSTVITRKITLPAGLSEDELEVQVEHEASQYIPFPLDEVSLDFSVVGPSANSPDDVEVLLAASRKEKVEDRVAIAESAGLRAKVMDIESYAARAALSRVMGPMNMGGAGSIVALIQIGAAITHVSVHLDGQAIYEREQPFGGNQLTEDIMRAYGLSYEEAEQKKRTGGLPENFERELLTPFLDSAGGEVSRAIQFFFTSTPYSRVDQICLAGGCSNIAGIVDIVASRAKVSTAVINPFLGMQLGASVREKQLLNEAPGFLVACGLAMRRFA